MHLLRIVVLSLWWIWVTLTFVKSELPSYKCAYYKLTMFMDCNNLNLGEIRPNTYPVNESRIQYLLLHHNSIRKLEYNVFYNLSNLQSLDLSDNFISSLDYRLFVKTPKLFRLNLRNNRLSILGDGRLFQFQKELTSLLLDFNRIKYINVSVLDPLLSLKELFLFGNSFVCNCELKKAMLWGESKNLETGAVCESPPKYTNSSWTILKIENCNRTENITTTKVEILDSRCKYDSIGKSLDCTDVPLRSISAKNFPRNLSLDSLVLQNTGISVLESDTFSSLSKLKVLDLSKNFLENLNPQIFSKLDQLTTLNISHNKLLSLPDDLFKIQKNIKVLKLNKNHLTHLREETLTPLISLEHLDLSENRFICDCDLRKTMFWCEGKHLSTGATCAFPKQFSGFSWTILQNITDCIQPTVPVFVTMSPIPEHHMSLNNILLIIVISTAIFFLLSLIGALWYICKRQRKRNNEVYDDICLEERNEHCYEVLEEKRENNLYSGTINKPGRSSKSDECEVTNTAIENTYEDIESIKLRNKRSAGTSQESPLNTSDLKDGNTGKNTTRDVPSYMDMSGATNKQRKENPYVLK